MWKYVVPSDLTERELRKYVAHSEPPLSLGPACNRVLLSLMSLSGCLCRSRLCMEIISGLRQMCPETTAM